MMPDAMDIPYSTLLAHSPCRFLALFSVGAAVLWFSWTKEMDSKRESDRIRDSDKSKVLDAAAIRRRQKKHLESLERDNFQDDPHANIVSPKKLPKFADDVTPSSASKKRRKRSDHFKLRFRKRIEDLEEEERVTNPNPPNYFSAKAPPSEYPQRRFCSVCGFPSNYTCIRCTSRYCCINCLKTHEDTRCLKFVT